MNARSEMNAMLKAVDDCLAGTGLSVSGNLKKAKQERDAAAAFHKRLQSAHAADLARLQRDRKKKQNLALAVSAFASRRAWVMKALRVHPGFALRLGRIGLLYLLLGVKYIVLPILTLGLIFVIIIAIFGYLRTLF